MFTNRSFWPKLKNTRPLSEESWVTLSSTKNTARITLVIKNRIVMYTSVRRSPDYPGYERRLGIARYTMARNFAREARKRGLLKKNRFLLRQKGNQKHSVLGLLDGGMLFSYAKEFSNPSFNGCRNKKARRK